MMQFLIVTLGQSYILQAWNMNNIHILLLKTELCLFPTLKHHHRIAASFHHRLSFELVLSVLSGINEGAKKERKVKPFKIQGFKIHYYRIFLF
jgi:hypothetical protein